MNKDIIKTIVSKVGYPFVSGCAGSGDCVLRRAEYGGLIGAGVFEKFVVTIDFEQLEGMLTPRCVDPSHPSDEPVNAGTPAANFHRLFRFGNYLAVPTFINGKGPKLFLIDSGGSNNLIDADGAREAAHINGALATVTGIQGKVKQVSNADRVALIFAGFRQESPTLVAVSLENMRDAMRVGFGGILGMPALGQMRLTIDYREGAVRFQYKQAR